MARLHDRLSVTVLFARQPPINLQQAEIRLVNSVTQSSSTVEPTITVLNDFKATIVYSQAALSLTGSYNVQIVINGRIVAQTPLNITVNGMYICYNDKIPCLCYTFCLKVYISRDRSPAYNAKLRLSD